MKSKEFFTNELDYKLNREEFFKEFALLELITNKKDEKEESYFSKLWKTLKENVEARAYFKLGGRIFLLMEKDKFSKIDKAALLKENCDLLRLDKMTSEHLPAYIFLNLLIMENGNDDSMFSIGNFQNGLFLIASIDKRASKIITLKFQADKENILLFNIVTFSKTTYNKNTKSKIFYRKQYQKLIRELNPEKSKENLYIKKAKFTKSNINFMDYYKNFESSKIAYLGKFLSSMKDNFPKILQLSFKKYEFINYPNEGNKDKRIKELKEEILSFFVNKGKIQLLDYEKNFNAEKKEALENSLKSYSKREKELSLFENKELSLNFVEELDENLPSLIFIFDKDYYEENPEKEDPYSLLKKKYKKSQIITYDVADKIEKEFNAKNQLYSHVILKELLIKLEIVDNNFILGSKLKNFLDYDFYLPKQGSWEKITFRQDGFKKDRIFSLENLMEKFSLNEKIKEYNLEILAVKGEKYFAIERTNKKILPDVLESYKINEAGKSLRTLEAKKYSLAGSGINYRKEKDYFEYFAALNTENLNKSLARANIIRKVFTNDENFAYDEFFASLDEYYVRNKEFTVLPLVLKYLREVQKL